MPDCQYVFKGLRKATIEITSNLFKRLGNLKETMPYSLLCDHWVYQIARIRKWRKQMISFFYLVQRRAWRHPSCHLSSAVWLDLHLTPCKLLPSVSVLPPGKSFNDTLGKFFRSSHSAKSGSEESRWHPSSAWCNGEPEDSLPATCQV